MNEELKERAREWVGRWNVTICEQKRIGLTLLPDDTKDVYEILSGILSALEGAEQQVAELTNQAIDASSTQSSYKNRPLTAMAGVVCTPGEGYIKAPYLLCSDIVAYGKQARQESDQKINDLAAENAQLWVRIESGEAAAYEQGKHELLQRICELEAERDGERGKG